MQHAGTNLLSNCDRDSELDIPKSIFMKLTSDLSMCFLVTEILLSLKY